MILRVEKEKKEYIMAFPSDGRNHHSAINNENITTKFLRENAKDIFKIKGKFSVEHKGGTINKADNVIITDDEIISISDKEKKKGLQGSFDYTNSSAAIKELIDSNNPAVKEIKNIIVSVKKDRLLEIDKRLKLVNFYRKRVKDACYQALNNLKEDDILDIINAYLINPNKDMHILITDHKNNVRYLFPFKDHPVNKLLKEGFKLSLKIKEGSSSGRIIFSKENNEIDIGLRIRIHTNNGVNALLGTGNSNNSSSFVLKFQQDSILNLIKDTKAVKYEK